jgi:NhaP-type Na+/H+ or K+/H+ antiporter
MFSVLQFIRGAAFLALVPCEVIGIAAIGAHILARWVPYFMYRFGAKDWPNNTTQTVRLLFFVLLSILFATTLGIDALLNWTAAALLGWNIFRARNELPTIIKNAARIDTMQKRAD